MPLQVNEENRSAQQSPPDGRRADTVIVIGRHFGSGARRIGRLVAKMLGIDYYDSELLARAAGAIGVRPEIFMEHDERKPSTLRTILQGAYGIPDNFHSVGFTGEGIYREQSRVIREVSRKGSCVIVGRTADVILKDHPGLFSVFLHAPIKERAMHIVERGEAASLEDAAEMASRRDREREAYYNYYSGDRKWGEASNYHLSIDTSGMDDEAAASLIVAMIKNWKKQK